VVRITRAWLAAASGVALLGEADRGWLGRSGGRHGPQAPS
jgi:hypothetical protein